MPTLTYRISVLGCRVNHAEARELESVLLERGLQRAVDDAPADIEVVHTCSVTNTAASKSRQAARRAQRRARGRGRSSDHAGVAGVGQHHAGSQSFAVGADPAVFVTGCYASTNLDEATALFAAHRVIPQDSGDGRSLAERFKDGLDEWLASRGIPHRQSIRPIDAGSSSTPTTSANIRPLPVIPPAAGAGSHIRAELRIQDGCDAHCTFCIIPKIRPTLRSKRISEAVREARMLVDLGHREIVLSGIFIGAYGHETALRRRQREKPAHPLAELLDAIAQVPGVERVRISSMEPGDVTAHLLDAIVANQPVVVPHLHLPLQSGSDRVLRRMNRQYSVSEYREMIAMVTERLSVEQAGHSPLPPAITTDIICGFPGETDADFQATVDVARDVGYLHMHVFPFSPKLGTAAARWRAQFVPEMVRKARVRTLIDLETEPTDGLAIAYHRRLVGRTVRVMIEQPDLDRPGYMTGRCDHYARVTLQTRAPRGSMLTARIDEAQPSHLIATADDRACVPLPQLA